MAKSALQQRSPWGASHAAEVVERQLTIPLERKLNGDTWLFAAGASLTDTAEFLTSSRSRSRFWITNAKLAPCSFVIGVGGSQPLPGIEF
jgi:hypothetical protein